VTTPASLRVVHDDSDSLAARWFCCKPVNGAPCMRKPQHAGGHLPPVALPRRDVSAANPPYRREVEAAS